MLRIEGPTKANTTAPFQSQQAEQGGAAVDQINFLNFEMPPLYSLCVWRFCGDMCEATTQKQNTGMQIVFGCVCDRAFISYIGGLREKHYHTKKKQMHSPQSMLSLLSKLLFCVFTDFRFVVGRTCLPWLYALHPGQNMNSVFAGKRAYNPNANSCSRLGDPPPPPPPPRSTF